MPPLLAAWPIAESLGASVWFWITVLVGLAWMKRHLDLNRGKREPILTEIQSGPEFTALPTLTILVAAKDEEANIERCIRGLLAQDYPRLQIIAIDDRSTDQTGVIIDRIAADDPRLLALHVHELRPGWFGKNHAMHLGMQHATGEYLCFTDADCTYNSSRLLSSAMRFAVTERSDLLSVLPRLEAGTFWERVVQPVAGAVMVFWFPPQAVNDPASKRAYANGAFMLMSRSVYERLGGHEPIKATLNEDMHLARRTKELGLRLRVVRGGDLYRVRMYVGFAQIWRGWSRIFYGCFGTFPRLLISVLMLAIFSVGPYVTLALAPFGGAAGWPLALAAGFAIVAQQSLMWRFYSVTGNGAPWATTYPLGAAICLAMTLNSMRRLAGTSTTWRGTQYTGGAKA